MDIEVQKHFVTFYSPGSFVAETTTKPVDEWNVEAARELAKTITERHGATPYGFRFSTRGRSRDDLDSKTIDTSPMYYIGGKVETYEEIVARDLPDEHILRGNMACNGYTRIWTSTSGWKWSQPLKADDVVLSE